MEPHAGQGRPVWTPASPKTGPKWVYRGLIDLSTISNQSTDTIEDQRERGPVEVADQHLLREEIYKILGQLTLRERQVIELRFGLLDGYDHTLEEISKKLKVTRERVRQIEERAIRKLRHPQAIPILKDYLD